ncbi:cytochrome c-type biogenesis protein CcsB [Flavobacterium arsenatis]|uniref:Cytochrome c-type biogenesis protein CcsB n=1 Tax=Flavobacterium arsenatis TaxID=1484332 RepID=A0ABU1TQX3_9FLAO|nr:cytochrome c biogenesis protein CcsA [Flavobacterium arsenatis]MDR6968395.1 cytochrome c-type biogenesis protein CcsB [Flavobacterium arsenatis]
MDNKILSLLASFFFSTRLMAVLFIGFALAMGIGTFIENEYNTDTARILIYNTRWFEAIMFFFFVNFFGNIKRYQLYKKEKWATLMLHLAFIFIIAGAFITRYISYEGMMPIREGEASNQFFSDKTYLTVFIDGEYKGEMKRKTEEEPLLLSPVTNNDFSIKGKFDQLPYEIKYENFIMGAVEKVEEDPKGITFLKMVESGGGTRHEHYLKEGEVQNIHNVLFSLNKYTAGAININTEGETYTIKAPFEGEFMRMADQFKGSVVKDTTQQLMMRSLYNLGGAQFVFPEPAIKGKVGFVSNNDFKDKVTDDALMVKIIAEGEEKEVTLVGSKGKMGTPQSFTLGKLDFTIFYGSKVYELPFKIKLNDFIASKYPGTEKSYSAYESQVTVMDGKEQFDARIFMNNVLDHDGYRFFQASFDPDELGTILSVNHDFWGTWITYIGYFILFFAMMAILFDKHTRFADIKGKLEKVKEKKAKLITIVVLFLSFGSFAQEHDGHTDETREAAEKFINERIIDKEHAEKFGRLVIQDAGGRMKPVNTFSSELLRKVSKSEKYNDMNSDQVFLSMTQYSRAWFEIPLVFIEKGNDSIRKIIGVDKGQKLIPFRAFFDAEGNYKLSPYLDDAYKSAIPNKFQEDFIKTDRKVNLLNSALSGSILRIFPIPNDENNKWVSHMELHGAGFKGMDSVMTKQILPLYFMALDSARTTKDYKKADFFLDGMHNFQKKYGSKVIPSDEKVSSEIAYNKYDIFKKLYYMYMLAGVLMLIFTIVNIFFEKKSIRMVINGFHILIGFFFALHTLGLIARWYISGHAPWSDAYESMIYVAWATMFFTLAFDRKSKLTVASGTFVASMILMIAHWNWMDPAIANLQPVLNSYWLMIHVAVIVGSYGPLTLAMILGVVSLILMLFTNEKNKVKMNLNIQEITYINEMAMTIGLVMLTIGNFLGGQWANESWGRYWGWDPKETWALISIMVYAFVIHARFVPLFRGKWTFNLMSILAFYSIMMTYFGVNFYLSGLHSYASGDQVVTPVEFYYSLAIVTVLASFAYFKHKKYLKK